MKLKGVVAAMVTPFDERGRIDEKALRELCRFEVSKNVNGVFALGTTGEGTLQDVEERKFAAEVIMDELKGKLPVVLHVGDLSVKNVWELSKHAIDIKVDAITSITPYYYKLTDEQLKDYYLELSKNAPEDYPVYIYNFPGITNNDVKTHVVKELIDETKNIMGIKFSSADMIRLQEYISLKSDRFNVLSGCDPLFYTMLSMGCDGLVSGNSNVNPDIFVKIYEAYTKGEYKKAESLQVYARATADLLRDGNIAVIKSGMKVNGLNGGYVRKPLQDLDEESINVLLHNLKNLMNKMEG
ncbi:dihydrodipicolinate synthase family protein [uncultured Clostridium sp.]|uniref:dihydrodipicolinate synthase family protein n=1 Tax=uncultured Clostridium sp. TaxID=59620 RepID=UPI0028E74FC7|nr:dihydrodipicolinate synthase family protein [uncultured Clostridium sp.]